MLRILWRQERNLLYLHAPFVSLLYWIIIVKSLFACGRFLFPKCYHHPTMASILNQTQELQQSSKVLGHVRCESYFLFSGESNLSDALRAVLYFLGLAYCFIGLSAITARFFKSMENVVKHSRKVVSVDPVTKAQVITYKKVWNFTIADISLLAFGTSFPQISLATIDAFRNMGERYAGGLVLYLTF